MTAWELFLYIFCAIFGVGVAILAIFAIGIGGSMLLMALMDSADESDFSRKFAKALKDAEGAQRPEGASPDGS